MKAHDTIVGMVFLCAGTFVAAYAHGLTPPRHLTYGPGFFPFLVGVGLMLVGGGIALQGIRTFRTQPLAVAPDWIGSRRKFIRFWILPLGIVFYMVAVEPLGFLATATLLLVAIMKTSGVSVGQSVAVGFIVALVVNLAFASFLHVPLAWGILTPISGWFMW